MNQNDAPRGTLGVVGHPSNDIVIVKGATGWRYIDTGEVVPDDAFRMTGWDEWNPGHHMKYEWPTREIDCSCGERLPGWDEFRQHADVA